MVLRWPTADMLKVVGVCAATAPLIAMAARMPDLHSAVLASGAAAALLVALLLATMPRPADRRGRAARQPQAASRRQTGSPAMSLDLLGTPSAEPFAPLVSAPAGEGTAARRLRVAIARADGRPSGRLAPPARRVSRLTFTRVPEPEITVVIIDTGPSRTPGRSSTPIGRCCAGRSSTATSRGAASSMPAMPSWRRRRQAPSGWR
jgi:hypothetical protein